MSVRKDRTIRVVRRAQRRALAAEFIRYSGRALALAACVAVALAVASRLLGWPVGWEVVLGVPAGLALAGAGVAAWLKRPSTLVAASRLDRANRLHDRVGTSLALRERAGEDPFNAWAVQEGEKAIGLAKAKKAAPIRFDRAWLVWPAVGTAAVLAFMLVPTLSFETTDPEATQIAEVRQQASDEIASLRERLERRSTEDPASFIDTRAEETLARLEEQLRAGEIDPDEARRRAAEALQRAADRARRDAQKRDAARDRLAEKMARAAAGEGEEGERSEFAERLSRGDFQGAQRELERALSGDVSDEERQQMARELAEMADRLDQMAAEEEERRDRSVEESLRRSGIDEQTIESLRNETDPDEIARELEREGMDSADARRMAERMAEENLERQAEEQAKQEAKETAEQAREASEQLQRDTRRPDPRRQEPREGQQREGQQREEPDGPPPLPEKDLSKKEQTDTSSEADCPEGGEGGSQGREGEGQESEGGEQAPSGTQGQQGREGQQPQGEPGSKEQSEPCAVGGMCDRLGGMGSGGGDGEGEQSRRQADELQRKADETLRAMGETGRDRAGRIARERELESERRPPTPERDGTVVDSRRPSTPDARERVLAEYFSDRPIDREARTQREELAEVVRSAERQAERAIEQQTVSPQRRSYIRRVFDRVPEVVGRSDGDGADGGAGGGSGGGG